MNRVDYYIDFYSPKYKYHLNEIGSTGFLAGCRTSQTRDNFIVDQMVYND